MKYPLTTLFTIILFLQSVSAASDKDAGSDLTKVKGEATTRIVGGTESTPGDWPWMAALIDSQANDNYDGQFCAGMLIHPHYILTAAHCVEDLEPADIIVVLGLHRLDDTNFGSYNIIDIIIHPDWDFYTSDSDLALLVLEEPATGIEALPLITDGSLLDDPGVVATGIGWGSINSDLSTFPFELQQVNLPILSNDTVNTSISYNGQVTTNMLAAGYMSGGKDTCQGDSGGPLIVPDGNGAYLLAGIVSWGDGCAEPNFPGIYTRVGTFRNWVFSHILPQYHDWELTNGVYGEYLDADSDSYSQLIEYSFGSNPNSGTSFPKLEYGFRKISSKDYFSVEFPTRTANVEIDYLVEGSSTLDSWEPLDLDTYGLTSTGSWSGEFTTVAVRSNLATVDSTKAFLRVRTSISDHYAVGTYKIKPLSNRRSALHSDDEGNPLRAGRYKKDYRIEQLANGQSYTLSLYSDEFNAYLQLLNAETLDPIASDNDSGPSTNAQITFVPQAGSNYLARVTTSAAGEEGRFSLGVARQIITPGQTITGSLTSSDETDPIYQSNTYYKDDYFLIAPANGRTIRVNMTSSDFDAFIEIIDTRDGLLIDSNDDISESDFNAEIDLVLYAGMEILIRVTSALEAETGNYVLKVSE